MTAWPCFYMFISYKNFHTSTMGGGYTKFQVLFCFFFRGRKRERAEGNGGNARASPFPCTGAALYCIISAHAKSAVRAWRNGRRAGFRIRYLCVWGFESLRSHQKSFGDDIRSFFIALMRHALMRGCAAGVACGDDFLYVFIKVFLNLYAVSVDLVR